MKARHVMTPISAHLMRSCRVKKFDTNREWNLNQSDTEIIIIIIIDKIANSKMSLKNIFYFNIIILTIYRYYLSILGCWVSDSTKLCWHGSFRGIFY